MKFRTNFGAAIDAAKQSKALAGGCSSTSRQGTQNSCGLSYKLGLDEDGKRKGWHQLQRMVSYLNDKGLAIMIARFTPAPVVLVHITATPWPLGAVVRPCRRRQTTERSQRFCRSRISFWPFPFSHIQYLIMIPWGWNDRRRQRPITLSLACSF